MNLAKLVADIVANKQEGIASLPARTYGRPGIAESLKPLSAVAPQSAPVIAEPEPNPPQIDPIVQGILDREKGISNNPADRGGLTNMGITKNTLSRYLGRPATDDDIRNLTPETANEIYKDEYMNRPGFMELPPGLRENVIDSGVMSDPVDATKQLQRVLKKKGFDPGKVDGILGPKTRGALDDALQTMSIDELNNAYVDERKKYYDKLVKRDPSQKTFRKGWMNRAEKFRSD